MSQFPKRLIDELGEGDARRLLASARTDEPPAKLVAAAILTATRPASAAEEAARSIPRPRESETRLAARNVAVVAGVLALGAIAVVAAIRETRSDMSVTSAAPPVAAPAIAATDDTTPSAPSNGEAVAAEGTSVAELPDAPAPRAAHAQRAEPKSTEQTADLLREANRLRAGGHWAEAAATYQKVIDLGPTSAEAYPADVALGNLELQQNRPLRALARYEHALASHPGGALSEEARWGKARALRAARRVAEERAALEDFRRQHPDSPLVSVATQRLSEIGDR